MTTTERIKALLSKTVANGCTPGEQAAAVAKARELVAKNGLKASSFKWPKAATTAKAPPKRAAKKAAAKKGAKGTTRHDRLVAMMKQPGGVTLDEVMKEFGVLRHSARAYISVASRKATGGSRATLDRETGVYRLG